MGKCEINTAFDFAIRNVQLVIGGFRRFDNSVTTQKTYGSIEEMVKHY